MSVKVGVKKEIDDLVKFEKPYESVAFIVFSLLLLQQFIYLIKNVIDFTGSAFLVSSNGWLTSNLMGFIIRILNLGPNKWVYIVLAILAYLLYYFFMYALIWKYCKKNNLAKWTWTLFVVFCPTIFLAPAYIWFVMYAFHPYLVKFVKKLVVEFNSYQPNQKPSKEKKEVEKLSKDA